MCLFRHRTAHKARRRTRATTSCRGGCCGLAELLFESLGARGGSQSPAHARQTGPKRLVTHRGGTRPTGVQYSSARGGKCARVACTHAAASLSIARSGPRARRDGAFCCCMCDLLSSLPREDLFIERTTPQAPTKPNTCVLLLHDLLQSCSRGGEDMCYERRRAEACVD